MTKNTSKKITPPLLASNTEIEAPVVLLPYQQAWVADDSPLKVGEKSRRIGLTWAEAADDALIAASDKKAGGQNVYYVGYNQDMTVEFIEACAMFSRAYNYVCSEIEEGIFYDEDGNKEIKTYTIRFPKSHHRIVGLSSRPSNLRGKQGVVVLDEAAFHEDLAGLIKSAMALLLWGGKVRIISTHNGESNAFNKLIKEIQAGKRKGVVHRTTFKQAVEQGLYKRVCLRLGIEYDSAEETKWVDEVYDFYGDAAEEELDVIPVDGGGKVLSIGLLEKLENKNVPVVRFDAPKDFLEWTEEGRVLHVDKWIKETLYPVLASLNQTHRHFYGLDFARHRDACSVWFQGQKQNLNRYCAFVLEMGKTPYNQQEQIMKHVVKRLPRFNHGKHDANGNGEYLAEQMQITFGKDKIDAVHLSETWYRENTPHFEKALTDGTIEDMPADEDIRDDHLLFERINSVMRIPAKRTKSNQDSGVSKRHGDSGIAHLLCDAASMIQTIEGEWIPVPLNEAELVEAFGKGMAEDFNKWDSDFSGSGCW